MKYNLYSIKDVLSGKFSRIEIFDNDAVALRWYRGFCDKSEIATDTQLYLIGVYDIETGVIESKVDFLVGGASNV